MFPRILLTAGACLLLGAAALTAAPRQSALKISEKTAEAVGHRIWRNECAGTVEGLTSWNKGEDFASLGIGHFIWYPKGQEGPFTESFPQLLKFYKMRGVKLPAWLEEAEDCPWKTRAEFMEDFNGPRLTSLRNLLKNTVGEQAHFAALRLEAALPKMLAEAAPPERASVQQRFYALSEQPLGLYALIDYVNFKGEGIAATERYNGQGWGLLQVLEGTSDPATSAGFAASARRVLTRRVENAPPARNEKKWLAGWHNRTRTYEK
jgi:hypothetical protein